jgi:hypothetical protein
LGVGNCPPRVTSYRTRCPAAGRARELPGDDARRTGSASRLLRARSGEREAFPVSSTQRPAAGKHDPAVALSRPAAPPLESDAVTVSPTAPPRCPASRFADWSPGPVARLPGSVARLPGSRSRTLRTASPLPGGSPRQRRLRFSVAYRRARLPDCAPSSSRAVPGSRSAFPGSGAARQAAGRHGKPPRGAASSLCSMPIRREERSRRRTYRRGAGKRGPVTGSRGPAGGKCPKRRAVSRGVRYPKRGAGRCGWGARGLGRSLEGADRQPQVIACNTATTITCYTQTNGGTITANPWSLICVGL